MGSETFIHFHLPNGKVDRKCPQNKATEKNLFRSNFCRFGYVIVISQEGRCGSAMNPTKNPKSLTSLHLEEAQGRQGRYVN